MAQGKRGMVLENSVEQTNNVYRQKGLALIDKVPTPWNVQYNKRTGQVYKAFPQKKGTVDFVGVSHGRAIAFDAKNTNNTTSFPLKNIEQHQVDYLLNHRDQGGISFIIIAFAKHQEHYFLPINDLHSWWIMKDRGGRKSIPYSWFNFNCAQVRSRNGVILDYLEHCKTAYKSKRDIAR